MKEKKVGITISQIWDFLTLISVFWAFVMLGLITIAIPYTRVIGVIIAVSLVVVACVKVFWNVKVQGVPVFEGLGFFKRR